MATGVSMRVTKYEHTEVARSSATLLRYEGDRGGTRHRDKMNYNLLFTITINNFSDSDDNWIKFKKEMPFRVDLHWCLILWFWLRDDDLLYLKRSRRSRARNFSAFWLLNSYLVGLSPIRWDESEVVLRNVRYTTQFSSLRFYLKVSVDWHICHVPRDVKHQFQWLWLKSLSYFQVWVAGYSPQLFCVSRDWLYYYFVDNQLIVER